MRWGALGGRAPQIAAAQGRGDVGVLLYAQPAGEAISRVPGSPAVQGAPDRRSAGARRRRRTSGTPEEPSDEHAVRWGALGGRAPQIAAAQGQGDVGVLLYAQPAGEAISRVPGSPAVQGAPDRRSAGARRRRRTSGTPEEPSDEHAVRWGALGGRASRQRWRGLSRSRPRCWFRSPDPGGNGCPRR